MKIRQITIILALLALALAAGAAVYTRDWMPLIMAAPVAVIMLINSGRPKA